MKKTTALLAAGLLAASLAPVHADSANPGDNPAPAGADFSSYKTADDAWTHLQALKKGPQEKPKSKEELGAFLLQLDAAAQDFAKRFPADARHWEAKMIHAQVAGLLAQRGLQGTPTSAKAEILSVAKEVIAAPDAPGPIKHDARYVMLQLECSADGATPSVGKDIEAFSHDYPNDPAAESLKYFYAKRIMATDPAKAQAIFQELAKSSNPQVAQRVASELKLADLMKKPLDLKYTAIDGREVDLSKMRGKVVLVDFWATWCGPCMSEVPSVVAAFSKYHDKGFEIVGISLDQNKSAVESITKEKGMTWPQYFDGKGWENTISSSFGIESIPAMWLVNKKGFVATIDGREDLEGQIQKLLAE
jgi:thiol-disulfide isomerase/thioredoxin